MKPQEFIRREVQAINRTLYSHGVDAGVKFPDDVLVGGKTIILYRVRRGRGVRIADVDRLLPELSEALGEWRGVRTPVRTQTAPYALEAPHPHPQPVPLSNALLFGGKAHTMLCGRSYGYQGAQNEVIAIESAPHTLIAGTTGAGKSVLMRNMLLSLAANTGPDALRLILIDRKNKDLRPLRSLPHVVTFAYKSEEAADAIAMAQRELERRMETGAAPYRLIVAIDELARLSDDKRSMALLNDILATGRSDGVNVVAATQHPTKDLLGKLSKVNFSVKLIGLVVDANTAQIAAGRPGTFAHLLPGRGAFLRIEGADMRRFQAFFADDDAFGVAVANVARQWRSVDVAPIMRPVTSPAPHFVGNTPQHDAIEDLADAISDLWEAGASKRKMCMAGLGKVYAGSYARKLDKALAILEERKRATVLPATTPTPVNGGVEATNGGARPVVAGSTVAEPNIWM